VPWHQTARGMSMHRTVTWEVGGKKERKQKERKQQERGKRKRKEERGKKKEEKRRLLHRKMGCCGAGNGVN